MNRFWPLFQLSVALMLVVNVVVDHFRSDPEVAWWLEVWCVLMALVISLVARNSLRELGQNDRRE